MSFLNQKRSGRVKVRLRCAGGAKAGRQSLAKSGILDVRLEPALHKPEPKRRTFLAWTNERPETQLRRLPITSRNITKLHHFHHNSQNEKLTFHFLPFVGAAATDTSHYSKYQAIVHINSPIFAMIGPVNAVCPLPSVPMVRHSK
jgi:hypothetical protein